MLIIITLVLQGFGTIWFVTQVGLAVKAVGFIFKRFNFFIKRPSFCGQSYLGVIF